MMHIKTSEQEKLKLGFGDYECNWGAHICGLYTTVEERDNIIMGFLNEGALKGDLQLYCPSERSEEDFIKKYSSRYPECCNHLEDKNLFQINSAEDLYYPDGEFSPEKMDEALNNFYEESQKNGKRNIRATAEMVWANEKIPGIEKLMIYESRLNYFIPGKPWISICLYNVYEFSGNTIMDVLRTHPYTINGGVIIENPFYQDPQDWLKENAPEYLEK